MLVKLISLLLVTLLLNTTKSTRTTIYNIYPSRTILLKLNSSWSDFYLCSIMFLRCASVTMIRSNFLRNFSFFRRTCPPLSGRPRMRFNRRVLLCARPWRILWPRPLCWPCCFNAVLSKRTGRSRRSGWSRVCRSRRGGRISTQIFKVRVLILRVPPRPLTGLRWRPTVAFSVFFYRRWTISFLLRRFSVLLRRWRLLLLRRWRFILLLSFLGFRCHFRDREMDRTREI